MLETGLQPSCELCSDPWLSTVVTSDVSVFGELTGNTIHHLAPWPPKPVESEMQGGAGGAAMCEGHQCPSGQQRAHGLGVLTASSSDKGDLAACPSPTAAELQIDGSSGKTCSSLRTGATSSPAGAADVELSCGRAPRNEHVEHGLSGPAGQGADSDFAGVPPCTSHMRTWMLLARGTRRRPAHSGSHRGTVLFNR